MSRKMLSDLSSERRKELKKKYRNPPTRQYRMLRVVRVACLLLALICAFLAAPLSPFGERYSMVFVVIGNILVVIAIVLDVTKMRFLREEYIEGVLNSKTKENRRAEKAARLRERSRQELGIEEMLNDESLSYWERLKLSARLSAQAAQESPREK